MEPAVASSSLERSPIFRFLEAGCCDSLSMEEDCIVSLPNIRSNRIVELIEITHKVLEVIYRRDINLALKFGRYSVSHSTVNTSKIEQKNLQKNH